MGGAQVTNRIRRILTYWKRGTVEVMEKGRRLDLVPALGFTSGGRKETT